MIEPERATRPNSHRHCYISSIPRCSINSPSTVCYADWPISTIARDGQNLLQSTGLRFFLLSAIFGNWTFVHFFHLRFFIHIFSFSKFLSFFPFSPIFFILSFKKILFTSFYFAFRFYFASCITKMLIVFWKNAHNLFWKILYYIWKNIQLIFSKWSPLCYQMFVVYLEKFDRVVRKCLSFFQKLFIMYSLRPELLDIEIAV